MCSFVVACTSLPVCAQADVALQVYRSQPKNESLREQVAQAALALHDNIHSGTEFTVLRVREKYERSCVLLL